MYYLRQKQIFYPLSEYRTFLPTKAGIKVVDNLPDCRQVNEL
jgi:hypothetical protein